MRRGRRRWWRKIGEKRKIVGSDFYQIKQLFFRFSTFQTTTNRFLLSLSIPFTFKHLFVAAKHSTSLYTLLSFSLSSSLAITELTVVSGGEKKPASTIVPLYSISLILSGEKKNFFFRRILFSSFDSIFYSSIILLTF